MSNTVSSKDKLPLPLTAADSIYIYRDNGDGTRTSYNVPLTEVFQGFIKLVPGFEGYIIIPADGNTDHTIVQENDILVGRGAYFNAKYVIMRALQDNPNSDAHFVAALNAEE